MKKPISFFTLLGPCLLAAALAASAAETAGPGLSGGRTNPLGKSIRRLVGPVPAGTFFFVKTNADGTLSALDNRAKPSAADLRTDKVIDPALNSREWIQNRERPEFRLEGDAAVAKGGCHAVTCKGNLNAPDAITVTMLDGQVFQGRVAALALSDGRQRVWLGTVQDCAGAVVGPPNSNQVLWANAFDGIRADVVVTYDWVQFAVDVIIRENVGLPKNIDPARARVEIWTEVFQSPVPERKSNRIKLRVDPEAEATHGPVEDTDEELNFGRAKMVTGSAFLTPPTQNPKGPAAAQVPVAKAWMEQSQGDNQGQGQGTGKGGRRFLLESADYLSLKPAFDSLGPPRTASFGPSEDSHKALASTSFLQSQTVKRRAQPPSHQPIRLADTTSDSSYAGVALRPSRLSTAGVVIDYVMVNVGLMNIKLGWGPTNEVGPAVVGRSTNDFWNQDAQLLWFGEMNSLRWSDQTYSPVRLTIQNYDSTDSNSTGDPMFDRYVWNQNSWDANGNFIPGTMVITLNNLSPGFYDIYLYAHGNADEKYSGFWTAPSALWQTTGIGRYWCNPIGTNWIEHGHYVVSRGVRVQQDQPLEIDVCTGNTGGAYINGLQLFVTATNSRPQVKACSSKIISSSNPATVVSASVVDDGLPNGTLTYQWTQVSGPGTATFNQCNYYSTLVVFSAAGTYVLRLTASDSQLTANDDVTVTVAEPPTISSFAKQLSVNGSIVGPLNFTVASAELPTTNLTVYIQGDASGVVLGGSGTNRTITFNPGTPAPGFITRDICVVVTDSVNYVASVLEVEVWGGAGSRLTPKPLLNVNFGAGNKVGPAAVGRATNDYWNVIGGSWMTYNNLLWSDGTPSTATVYLTWADPPWGTNATGDAMFSTYLTNSLDYYGVPQTIQLTIGQLGSGHYDIYLYGHGLSAGANTLFNLWTPNVGTLTTGVGHFGDYPMGTNSMENGHYVVFRGVPGQYFQINLEPNASGLAFLNGLQIVALDVNTAPSVDAGPPRNVVWPNQVSLNGTVTDDGLPIGVTNIVWSLVSGPGTVTFSGAHAAATTVTLSAPGLYRLRLTADDTVLTNSADVTVTANAAPTITCTNTWQSLLAFSSTNLIILPFSVSDTDGVPVGGVLTSTWGVVGGPGTVTFGNASSPTTSAHFSAPGSYSLQLTASDGELSSANVVSVRLCGAPTISGLSNQAIYYPQQSSLSLAPTISGDGLPSDQITCQWSRVSGPGTFSFSNTNSSATSVSFSALGTYTFQLAASNGQAATTSNVVITVTQPTWIGTIPDQLIPIGGTTGPVPFSISSTMTPATDLSCFAYTSDTNLVPVSNISLGGSGASRTVTVTPAPGVSGAVRIRVRVVDVLDYADSIFSVTVGDVAPGAVWGGTSFNYVQGNWSQAFGAEGYMIVAFWTNYPSCVRVVDNAQSYIGWAYMSNDPRALESPWAKLSLDTNRVAYADSATDALSYNLSFTDGFWHEVALYLLDWDRANRSERIEVWDVSGTTQLGGQDYYGFGDGVYSVWYLKGNVQIRVLRTGGPNAVVSGLFFGGRPVSDGISDYITYTQPVVSSAPTQTISYPNSATLYATIANGQVGSDVYSWSTYSGPNGAVAFFSPQNGYLNATSLSTTATFTVPGVYTLCLTIWDNSWATAKYTTVTVKAASDNDPLPPIGTPNVPLSLRVYTPLKP